jgi:GT2 family glycosyltransferase
MISVVIPSFNRRECILQLLRDLYRQQGVDFEVIVVDDASPDDSVAAIRREFPQVRLFVNDVNAGPCVSRNRGVQAAEGEFIVGLDSDVTVPDRQLLARVLEKFSAAPDVSGFAFRIFEADGITDDKPRWWHPVPIERGKLRAFETDYFSGTAYAFRRSAMIRAGLYPEILYMHYEEVELALRVLDQGGSIAYDPDLTVVHHANPVSRRGLVQVYLKPRNQILLAVSCFPLSRLVSYLVPRSLSQFLKAVRNGHLREFRRAVKDALVRSQKIERRPLRPETLRAIKKLRAASS